MSDGMLVPHAHDGMAAFPGDGGKVVLVCNHELEPAYFRRSAFGESFEALPRSVRDKVYDPGDGRTPGAGGTTTKIYDPATGRTEQEYLSLAGTELNCAGGPTPWGSWLSCEECFETPGTGWSVGRIVNRERPHRLRFRSACATPRARRAETDQGDG